MKIVEIIWLDSHSLDAWAIIKDLAPPKGKKLKTVGYLVAETKDAVSVAGSIGEEPPQACCIMTIPKFAIKSKKILQK